LKGKSYRNIILRHFVNWAPGVYIGGASSKQENYFSN